MFCAEQSSTIFFEYKESFNVLLENMKMNFCNEFLLSKIKTYIFELYRLDFNGLIEHLDDFFCNQGIGASHKFIVYALYHLPSTFSNFEAFIPFFKPCNQGVSYDLCLTVKWILDSVGPLKLSEAEKRYKIYEWIFGKQYKLFSQALEDYLKLREKLTFMFDHLPIALALEGVFSKFNSNPEKVLKMAVFERDAKFLPLVVYIYLNPSMRFVDCANDQVLNGLLKLNPNGVEATRSIEFLKQTIFDLKSYKPILISEMFTDVVRENLKKFLQVKLETVSSRILI
jgi:hypothetical protein